MSEQKQVKDEITDRGSNSVAPLYDAGKLCITNMSCLVGEGCQNYLI